MRITVFAALIILFGAGIPGWTKDRPKPQPDPIMESDQPGAADKALKLPVLEEGPGKGNFIYYESRYYDAKVNERGVVLIRLKDDDGKPQQDWWQVSSGISTSWRKLVGYRSNGRGIYKGFARLPKEFEDADDLEPTDDPRGKITVEAILMDDVEFVRSYEFDRDEIKIRTGFEEDRKGHRSQHRPGVNFAACMKFDPSVPQTERAKALEGYEVRLEGKGKERRQKIGYANSEDFKVGLADKVEATGPWGERIIRFKTKKPIMHTRKYRGKCPYQGFSFYYNVPNDSTSLGKQVELTIEIE